MDTVFKTFSADVKTLPDSRQFRFIISTDAVDRDGDVIHPKSWQLDNYQKNPIVAFAHDYSALPIAKCTEITRTPHGLEAIAEFPAKGVYAFADTVFDLVKGGFLSATSVGFKPIESTPSKERGKGIDYQQVELLEFSIVPIGANQECLIQLSINQPQYKGLLKPLVEWSEKFLGEYYGERGVWLPASQIEKTFEAITKSEILKPKDTAQTKEPIVVLAEETVVIPAEETLEIDEELVLELAEDVFDVELDLLAAHVQEESRKALSAFTEQEVTRAINYARGRVF
jgi:HK97 family phage prohead protease